MDKADQIRGALWGLLVADAMGVPHEFKAPVREEIEMVMHGGYDKTWKRIPYGTWSDDGSLTLAMADSLNECGSADVEDYGRRLLAWYTKGAYTPDGKTFDIGNTTQEAILRLARGHSARTSGMNQESNNGNGSLMRTLPIALFHRGTDEELFHDAAVLSAVTHAHETSTNACGIYSVVARSIFRDNATPLQAFRRAFDVCPKIPKIPPEPGGSGFVLDSLSFAVKALREDWSYEHTVREAMRLGGDTDTQAAIGGGIVALRYGVSCIPQDWMRDLRGKRVAESIIERFVKVAL